MIIVNGENGREGKPARQQTWSEANQDVICGADGCRKRNDGANGYSLLRSRWFPNLIDHNVRRRRNHDVAISYNSGSADSQTWIE